MPYVQELKAKHREVMQDVLMDVLRALTSPNMDIRKKTLDIALDLITSRNIDEVKQQCYTCYCLYAMWYATWFQHFPTGLDTADKGLQLLCVLQLFVGKYTSHRILTYTKACIQGPSQVTT